MKKIVITGMGAVTPIGIGVDNYWENITAGASGIDTIKSFDASELAVQIAGEVKNFNPSDYMPKDLIRKTDPFMQYAYIAAEEALKQSNLEIEPERTGIVMGTAMNGIATIAFTQDALSGAAHKKVGPRFIPKILGNIAAANIAIDHNIQGPSLTVSTACSSGGDAINTACMCMQTGKADVMLAVGAESVLCPLVIYSLANAKALSRRNDSPATASRPFDVTRDGFVIGEGGGALVVEDNQLVLRVSVTPQVLENGSNIEPVSLRAYFRNLDELNDDFQAVIKQLRTAAEPSSADLRQYEELCLKQGFNKFVARSACETARQGFLFVAEELEKAAPDAKSSVNS